MELTAYLENLIETSHCPITFAGDVPNPLSRWLVRSANVDPALEWGMEPCLDTLGHQTLFNELALMPVEQAEANWRLYISDILDRYQEVNSPKKMFTVEANKRIYSVNNVYCEKKQDILVNVIANMPTPIRLWINGQLVMTGSEDFIVKDYLFVFRFREGNNVVLLENPLSFRLPVTYQEFIVKLNPLSYLTDPGSKLDMLDKSLFEYMEKSYMLFLDKACYEIGESIRLIVLPQYIKSAENESIQVTVYAANGDVIAAMSALSSTVIKLDLPLRVMGALQIIVNDLDGGHRSGNRHFYMGSMIEDRNRLIEQAEERLDSQIGLITALKELTDIPAVYKGLNLYVTADIYKMICDRIAAFERYISSPDALPQKGYQDVFGSKYTVFEPRPTGDGYTAYNVHLPEGYDLSAKYPLVVFFHDGHGRSYPVELPWMQRSAFTEAVIVDIVGIGRLNIVDDIRVIETIRGIVQAYPIDRNRIYGIGFCTGGPKTYRIAFEAPDLFAGVASVVGDMRLNIHNPEYSYLSNLSNTTVFGLCSTENWFFNSARKVNFLRHFKKSKIRIYHGFMHNEFNSLNNSYTLFRKLIQQRKEAYPKELNFTALEPGFNKSHWLKIDDIANLQAQATIKAKIQGRSAIHIELENICRALLFINKKDMGLEDKVVVTVNGSHQTVQLHSFCCITLMTKQDDHNSFEMIAEKWTKEQFADAYQHIGVEERRMGIKQVYFHRCMIVRADRMSPGAGPFKTKLAYLLQNPIADRYIYYKYDACYENEIDLEAGELTNAVFILDTRHLTAKQQELLYITDLKLESGRMTIQGQLFQGDYFAFLTCSHPRSEKHRILVVAYNNDRMETEMIHFINSFDTNSLFYNDAVVFHNERYHPFREQFGNIQLQEVELAYSHNL